MGHVKDSGQSGEIQLDIVISARRGHFPVLIIVTIMVRAWVVLGFVDARGESRDTTPSSREVNGERTNPASSASSSSD